MDQERLAFVALHFIPGLGDILIKQLVSYCGSALAVFQLPVSRLTRIPGIGPALASTIHSNKPFFEAEKVLREAERQDATLLFFHDKLYPQRLKLLDDAPSLIYWKGNVNLNAVRIIALVGTREATSYGKEMVQSLIEEVKGFQPLIVSGLAYGIDIEAHKCALRAGLSTVGVLGSGLDVIYPGVHHDVAKKMMQAGGLMTEHPFGTKPDPHHFPARNRMIAGLCDALVVVEAADTGGALITASIADSYNKDVFAIPGRATDPMSEGCNRLIKTNKAHLITSGKDIAYIMNWDMPDPAGAQQLSLPLDIMDEAEKRIVNLLAGRDKPIQIDDLCLMLETNQGSIASILLSLELKNIVSSFPGKQYGLRRRTLQG
ncbi:MAG: DNA-processing protein DprA [Cyclobacteriaceae bacterium]